MPAITYDQFDGGLDRRSGVSVQDANRLWVCRNAFITLDKRIRKRQGLNVVQSDLAGTFGLEAINGKLSVFAETGVPVVTPANVDLRRLDVPSTFTPSQKPGNELPVPGKLNLDRVEQVEIYEGFPYVVARYAQRSGGRLFWQYFHHYLDGGGSTLIADTNCPNSGSITKAGSRIYAINGATVRYCKAGAARDWTTANDAGFLPTGRQQGGQTVATAVGTFEDSLVVFFNEGAQVWSVAVDPTANRFVKRISGVGTTEPRSLSSFARDLVFLSPFGFRSLQVQVNVERIDDNDIGTPIDALVVPEIDALGIREEPGYCMARWLPQLGQMWQIFDFGTYSKAWVYTFSQRSGISAWSEYTLPVNIKAITTLNGKVYLRTATTLYTLEDTRYTDAGTTIPVEVQMAYQSAKSPGVTKQFWGADLVVTGAADLSFKYDPRDQSKESIVQTLTGDTRPGDLIPVEINATSLAPVFRHAKDEAFQVDAIQLYYNALGPV